MKCDNDEVYHQEYGIASDDPPVDSGAFLSQEVETALDNELTEGSLLHDSRDADVTDTEENRVHNDETLGCRVRERQQSRIDGVC